MQLPKQNLSPKLNTNWIGDLRYGEREQKSSEKLVYYRSDDLLGIIVVKTFFSRESF